MSNTPMIPIQHRLSIKSAPITQALHQFECSLRVSIPAIVVANQDGNAFNADLQTVSVQPAIQEVIRKSAVPTLTTLPILDDVPFVIPRAGGWSLTLPIAIGDECLVVFADLGIDMWWQNGGVQKQPDGVLYRHDIGDALAIFGPTSKPRALPDYSATSAQLRSDDGTVVISLSPGSISITAPSILIGDGGTASALMTKNFLDYWNVNILPFLGGLGYGGPAPPTDSVTEVVEGQ